MFPFSIARAAVAGALAAAVALPAAAGGDPGAADTILLKLRTTNALQPLLNRYKLTLQATLGARPIYRVKVKSGTDVNAVITQMLTEPDVQLAEPNYRQESPEARKNILWAIGTESDYRAQWAPDAMRLADAQARANGKGVRVAVLDTGVDLAHPALAGRLLPGYDFVDGDHDPSEVGSAADAAYGHGTHVAGLVLLAAPKAKIIPVRVLKPDGSGSMWNLAKAMLYAVDPDGNPATDDGAHVINLSLGSLSRTKLVATLSQIVSCNAAAPGPEYDLSDPGYNDDKARCDAFEGVVVVAASGNDASDKTKQYPAAENEYGLLSVAAANKNRKIASFSNKGGWIQSAAPGDRITSTIPGGGYATWSGTSMATPLAAGTAALVRQLNPTMSAKNLVRRIEDTLVPMCDKNDIGQIDALAAVTGVAATPKPCP